MLIVYVSSCPKHKKGLQQNSLAPEPIQVNPEPLGDPPARPPAAYKIFCNATRGKLLQKGISEFELSMKQAHIWQQLDDAKKWPFERKRQELMEVYNKELSAYEARVAQDERSRFARKRSIFSFFEHLSLNNKLFIVQTKKTILNNFDSSRFKFQSILMILKIFSVLMQTHRPSSVKRNEELDLWSTITIHRAIVH